LVPSVRRFTSGISSKLTGYTYFEKNVPVDGGFHHEVERAYLLHTEPSFHTARVIYMEDGGKRYQIVDKVSVLLAGDIRDITMIGEGETPAEALEMLRNLKDLRARLSLREWACAEFPFFINFDCGLGVDFSAEEGELTIDNYTRVTMTYTLSAWLEMPF
jgi:hypothetical protein